MSKNKTSADSIEITPRRAKKPRNQRELGQAVFAEVDPVAVARGLLNSESETVKVRTLETLVNWAFRSPAAESKDSGGQVQIVWDLLAPLNKRKPS